VHTILTYHTIADYKQVLPAGVNISVDDFRSQMEYLFQRKYRVIRLERMVKYIVNGWKPEKNCLSITFDDGYEDHFTNVYPILEKYGFPATIFLTVKYINGYWKSEKAEGGNIKALSRDQILEMQKGGLIKFGSHGYSHANLIDIAKEKRFIEIRESKLYLEDLLGEDVSFISYPFGVCNEEIKSIVRDAGYKAGFSVWNRKLDIYSIPRVPLHTHDGIKIFRFKISSLYFPLKSILRFA
jgi:peptidoglycan/xylan/chitin deacetylase (PgdA/CDA1 family)